MRIIPEDYSAGVGSEVESRPKLPATISGRVDIALPHERVSVFVSSTIGELRVERGVARRVLGDDLDLSPVVFEAGARPHPPRDLYRAYLQKSHIVVAIYWSSYGWVAPDMEISGIHDELELARALRKPLLVYLKRTSERDPRLKAMIESISSEVTFVEFDTPDEFGELLKQDVARLLSERFIFGLPRDTEGPEQSFPAAPDLLNGLRDDMHARGAIPRPGVLSAISERLQNSQRLLLVGPPGVGKTFLLGGLGNTAKGVYVSLTNQTTQQVCQHLANRLRILRGEIPQRNSSNVDAQVALQTEIAASEQVLLIDHADQNAETTAALLSLTPFRCRFVFTSRTPDPGLFGHIQTFEVPPFSRDEIKAFLGLKTMQLPPGELEQLQTASAGNPLYLYFFATQQISPLPEGLHQYQQVLYERLSPESQHVLNLVAVSLVPLQIANLHTLLRNDGTIAGPPTRTREIVTVLAALVRSIEGRLEVFHPHFREFILGTVERDGLARDYHQQLANLAVELGTPYPAAYHLFQANDPRERDYLPEGARIARLHGRWHHTEVFTRRLIDLAVEDDDLEMLLSSKMALSELLSHMGRHDEARCEVLEAIDLAKEHHATEMLTSLELWSSTLLVDDNRPAEAIKLLSDMLVEHTGEDSHLEAGILFNLSFAYLRTSLWRQGAIAAERAHKIFTKLGIEESAYMVLGNLGGCLMALGEGARASRLAQQLLDYARERHLPREEAAALNILVRAHRRAGKPSEAEACGREALAIWQRLGVIEKQAMSLNNLGNTLKDQDRYPEAEAAYLEALKLATENDLDQERAAALGLLSKLRLAENRVIEAISYGEQGLPLHRASHDLLHTASTLENLGMAYKQAQRYSEALTMFEEAGATYERIEYWRDMADAFEEAIDLSKLGDTTRTSGLIERAVQGGLRDRDGNRVVDLLQMSQPEGSNPPYLEALDHLLSPIPLPRLGLYLTNVVRHAKTLPRAERDLLLRRVIERLLEHSLQTGDKSPLGAIGTALMITGVTLPRDIIDLVRGRVQEVTGIHYRQYRDGRSIWTLGIAWEQPLILQLEVFTDEPYFQNLSLAFTLYMAANKRRLEEGLKALGGNRADGLRFVLCSGRDFESYINKGKVRCDTPSPEIPAVFVGFPSGDDRPEEWSQMWVVLVNDLQALSDVTDGVSSPAIRIVVGELTRHLILRCTKTTVSSEPVVNLVVTIFKDTFS